MSMLKYSVKMLKRQESLDRYEDMRNKFTNRIYADTNKKVYT